MPSHPTSPPSRRRGRLGAAARAGFALALLAPACRPYLPPPPSPDGAPGRIDAAPGRADVAAVPGTIDPDPPAQSRADAAVDAVAPSEPSVADASATALDLAPEALGATGTPAGAPPAPPPAPAAIPACGTARPDIAGITGADGLAIARDGAIYFTQVTNSDGFVGRIPPGGVADPRWVRIPGGNRLWGLAIDSGRQRLYVAVASASQIATLDLAQAAPTPQIFLAGVTDPNDIVVAPSGDVYFTIQGDKRVHRATPTGARTVATNRPLGMGMTWPVGLAFSGTGELFVGLRSGPIHRILLDGGMERARSAFSEFDDWGNGLAFDADGRLYVAIYRVAARERVVRISADGRTITDVAQDGQFGALAFGRGALPCNDLYVADLAGPLRRITVDTVGLPLP